MSANSFRPVPAGSESVSTACFSVHAVADPGVMPRVLEVFAKRGLVPTVWHGTVTGPENEELQMDIQMRGLDPAGRERLAAAMRQVVGVEVVLTAEKRTLLTA